MFVGHYGVSFAAKPLHRPLPLWLLFIAVQWLDIGWSILVMAGVEKLRVVKGFTEGSDLDLYYMPYTHGLIGALTLSALLGAVSALFFRGGRRRAFFVVAACAFSHWLLDLVVHVPDLPLIGDTAKVGFGLWRHLAISFPLEMACLWAGAMLYARALPSKKDNIWLWAFVGALLVLQVYGSFGPAPASPIAEAQTALLSYIVLALLAGMVDNTGKRVAAPDTKPNSLVSGGFSS